MRNTLTLLSITALIALFAAMIQGQLALNSDVSWLAHATERMLAGGNYVNNFFETNPPLILYLLLPAILTMHHFSLAFVGALKSYIFLLSLFSLAMNAFLLHKIFISKEQRIHYLMFTVICGLFLLLPMEEFGQREHIALLFIMPYVLLAAIRKINTTSIPDGAAITIGLFASFGFCLKPFFIIPLLCIEIYIKRWQARPEIFPFLITPLIYTLIVALFLPDYFLTVMPYATRLYYLGYGEPFWRVANEPCFLFSALTIVLWFVKTRYVYLQRILIIATMSFCLAHLAQRMSLFYHVIPALSFAIMSYALTFYSAFTDRQPKASQIAIFAVLGISIFWYMAHYFFYLWTAIVFTPNLVYTYLGLCTFLCLYLSPLQFSFIRASFITAIITLNVILLSYFIQFTNAFAYRFPLTLALFMVGLLCAMKASYKYQLHHGFYAIILSVLFAFPVYHLQMHYQNALSWRNVFQPLLQYLKQRPQYHSFYVFADSPLFTFQLIDHTNLQLGSRFPFMWMVSGLAKQPDKQQKLYQKDRDFLLAMINADFQRYKPDLLLVDVREKKFKWNAEHYDYLADFAKNLTFRNNLMHYRYLTTFTLRTPDNQLNYPFALYERIQ